VVAKKTAKTLGGYFILPHPVVIILVVVCTYHIASANNKISKTTLRKKNTKTL